MLTFKQFLIESFNQPVKYTWIYKTNTLWKAIFIVDDISYEVVFESDDEVPSKWDVVFDIKDRKASEAYSLSGTGNVYEVFSTIYKIVIDFLNENQQVRTFYFTAKEDSRKKFYSSFSRKLFASLPTNKWQLNITGSGVKYYRFTKQN